MSEPRSVNAGDVDDRLRRILLIVRRLAYSLADQLGDELGLDRPCACEGKRGKNPERITRVA